MDRLTIKPGICAMASTEFCESMEDCYMCSHGKKMRFRLSDYEDTGLTPEEIKENQWVSVKECLPEDEKEVFICAERKHWRTGETIQITSLAFYESGTITTGDSAYNWDDDCTLIYDEDCDEYLVPKGWFESVSYSESFSPVDCLVTHWMKKPKPPKEGRT